MGEKWHRGNTDTSMRKRWCRFHLAGLNSNQLMLCVNKEHSYWQQHRGSTVFCANYYRLRLSLPIWFSFSVLLIQTALAFLLRMGIIQTKKTSDILLCCTFQRWGANISPFETQLCNIKKKKKKKTCQSKAKVTITPKQNLYHSLLFLDCN